MSRKPRHHARPGAPATPPSVVPATAPLAATDAPAFPDAFDEAPIAAVDEAGQVGSTLQRVEDGGRTDVGVDAGPVVATAGPAGVFPNEAPESAPIPLSDPSEAVRPVLDEHLLADPVRAKSVLGIGQPALSTVGIHGAGPTPVLAGPPLVLPLEVPQPPPDALPGKDPALDGDVSRAEGIWGGTPPVYVEPGNIAQGYVAPVDRTPAPGSVRITCTRPGHERGGIAHPATAVYAPATFTARQLAAFEADPLLSVLPLVGAAVVRAPGSRGR